MKKKGETKLLITIEILIILLSVLASNVAATPVVDEINYEPENPAPESTVTFTATISGDNITMVNITVSECIDSEELKVCFSKQTVTMTELGNSEYRAEINLQEDRANYIQYYFDITADGIEERLVNSSWKVNLSTEPNDNGSNGNGNGNGTNGNGDNGSPGFEAIVFFIAVAITAMVIIRKRLK